MQNKDCLLREGERLDDLQCQGLQIIQHPGKFCFGMDAVLLSSFAALRNKDTVMDLCTCTGILPILLSAKTEADHIDALEVQKESAEMARRSIILNELSNRITIYEGDVKTASDQFGKKLLRCCPRQSAVYESGTWSQKSQYANGDCQT